ncbi:hypothetical protein K8I31_17515 [bacterium]|nr:hypothetical protein [bacterium]
MAKQKRPWRFLLEGIAVGFILTVILIVAIPRMLREQQRYESHHPDTSTTTVTYTGDPYHVAIFGRGYFEFAMPDGVKVYSRISEFKMVQGKLTSLHGYPITQVNPGSDLNRVNVWSDGILYAQSLNSFKPSSIFSAISLYLFENSSQLEDLGNGYYKPTAASGKPVEVKPYGYTNAGVLLQGWRLERTTHRGTPPHQVVNEPYNGPGDYPNEPIAASSQSHSFAIEGRGFAAVLQPSGRIGYTRVLKLAQTPSGQVVRAFPPTRPYQKFTYAGELEKSESINYPFMVGLPIIKQFEGEYPKYADLLANPFQFAKPLEDQTETITISMQYGVRRGHHPYAFKNIESIWHSFESLSNHGVDSIESVTVLTNELGRPFHIPQAVYCSNFVDIEEIQLFDFDDPGSLHYRLNGVYEQTDRSGPARKLSKQEAGVIKRGYINQVEAITP